MYEIGSVNNDPIRKQGPDNDRCTGHARRAKRVEPQ